MTLFDSTPETPELTEAQQAAFNRDADVQLCVHWTGIKLGTGPDGETVLIVRTLGHTKDQEDLENRDSKIATDYALSIEDASIFMSNMAVALQRAIEREDPLAALLASLLLAAPGSDVN